MVERYQHRPSSIACSPVQQRLECLQGETNQSASHPMDIVIIELVSQNHNYLAHHIRKPHSYKAILERANNMLVGQGQWE
jgi:hypothetical protein